MKKLMTSLLAVLLCGLTLCWANAGVKVTVTCNLGNGSQPSSTGLTGTVALYQNDAAVDGLSATLNGGVATISNVPAGTYTVKFTGDFQGKACAGERKMVEVSSDAATNNTVVETNLIAEITSTGTDPTPSTVSMSVFVGAEVDYYGSIQFQGIPNATVTCKKGETVIDTKTTGNGWSDKGIATFTGITAGETYSFSVTANGYKDKTVTDVTGVANDPNERSAFKIAMEEAFVTVSGTLKVGETALTELPEGMSLMIGANGAGYTAQISESGYTVECKAGELKVGIVDQLGDNWSSDFSKNLTANYTVTTPENGSFTVADGVETFTQNIVLTKNYAAVIGVDASDKLLDNELTLTKQGETEVAYKAQFLASPYPSNHFRFNKVEAGTYTLGCAKFGYKFKGEAPVVTVAADLADVTLSAQVEIEQLEEVTSTWKGTVQYYDANWSYITVENADIALYARNPVNGEKTGEPLATAKSAADGTYSISVTGKLNTSYILTVTAPSIMPFTTNVTASKAENTVDGTINALWVSGKVEYNGEITGGTIKMVKSDDQYFSSTNVFDPETGMYYIGKSSAADGNGYTISFEGKDADKFVLNAKEENVDFSNGPITKNLTAAKDENKGYMTIRLRYRSTADEIIALSSYRFTFDENTYNYADAYGNAEFLVEKGSTHNFAVEEQTSRGYGAVAISGIDAFREIQGKMVPNDTTIFIPGLAAKHIKLSGTVTMPEGVSEEVKVAVRTVRDLVVMSTPIVKEGNVYKYAFEDVPVAASGTMPIFLYEPDAKYNATYKTSVPYNYDVKAAANGNKINVDPDMTAENTKDIEVVKIACNVSGTVSPAKTGNVTLTAAGETEPSLFTEIYGGKYKFQGVPAGTYTLTVKCDGYKTVTKEVTVADELADVTVDAITLEAVPMTVTVGGSLGATNPNNNKYVTFDGAKLAIYKGTEELAKTTLPENSYGYIPSDFTFQATAGTKVTFKMEHPSIEPVSKEYTVNGSNLTISASDLGYKFIDNTPDENVVMTAFKAEWNATFDSLKLSWTWPEGADGKIQKITLSRKLSTESGSGFALKTWEKTGENPNETYAFAANELPVAYTDTVKQTLSYTYIFEILYADKSRKDVSFIADMREGLHFNLSYTVNSDKMGTITSYGQPEGEYMEGDLITLTAKAKEGYKFVEFRTNDQPLSEAERENLKLYGDTVAIYGFHMPARDLTVMAIFASRTGEPTEYTVTLVSNNEAWGTVSGAGTFEEGKEIEVKATVTDETKYEFVAWKEGDKEVSKDATYKFKVEKDITLTAVFQEKTANENLKAARWTIFAEDGAIVIKGINGDRYDIYDLNGRLSGSALCTGAEIRLNVAKSKLYIVRRLGADGSFDAKKIVVR